jgi:hypothetical protein
MPADAHRNVLFLSAERTHHARLCCATQMLPAGIRFAQHDTQIIADGTQNYTDEHILTRLARATCNPNALRQVCVHNVRWSVRWVCHCACGGCRSNSVAATICHGELAACANDRCRNHCRLDPAHLRRPLNSSTHTSDSAFVCTSLLRMIAGHVI